MILKLKNGQNHDTPLMVFQKIEATKSHQGVSDIKKVYVSLGKNFSPASRDLVPRSLLRGLGIAKAIVRPAMVSWRGILR